MILKGELDAVFFLNGLQKISRRTHLTDTCPCTDGIQGFQRRHSVVHLSQTSLERGITCRKVKGLGVNQVHFRKSDDGIDVRV